MSDITIHFDGPLTFCAGERSLFHSAHSSEAGIYIWTFRQTDGSHLIHYVGETAGFAKRHREHLVQILGLNYGIWDPKEAENGTSTIIWPGLWRDKSADGPSRLLSRYAQLASTVIRYVHSVTVFFARLQGDTQLRRHIEGCIGWNLRENHPELRFFFPDDNRIARSPAKKNMWLLVSASENVQGLDSRIAI